MDRRSIHRGLVALTLAVGLMLAGVQPAAAREPGFRGPSFERLLRLWDGAANDARSLWEIVGGWVAEKTSFTPDDSTVERGAGLDPNGTWLQPSEDPSAESPNG